MCHDRRYETAGMKPRASNISRKIIQKVKRSIIMIGMLIFTSFLAF